MTMSQFDQHPPSFSHSQTMVTGQLTRAEAESALKRLQGLRDDWERQRNRWSEHHQKAADLKALQRNPSAPLTYTVEVCCNQMGIATIRFNELERLIQDFRACALYLVHLPVPEGPDASFRSALPDLWSIPHSAPGTAAVAMPGQVAGFSAQMAPVNAIQGLSDQIMMYNGYPGTEPSGFYGSSQMMPGGGMQQQAQQMQMTGFPQQQAPFQQQSGFQQQPSSFQQPQQTGFQHQPSFQSQNSMMALQTRPMGQYSSQPLAPQHTQAIYNQQLNLQQQSADQARVNQFSANVFQQQPGFQSSQLPANGYPSNASPLNPFNPNAPHGAVLDASKRYPAVQ